MGISGQRQRFVSGLISFTSTDFIDRTEISRELSWRREEDPFILLIDNGTKDRIIGIIAAHAVTSTTPKSPYSSMY